MVSEALDELSLIVFPRPVLEPASATSSRKATTSSPSNPLKSTKLTFSHLLTFHSLLEMKV